MTQHEIINANSNCLDFLESGSIHLIVTSPPYPMIEMWDELFVSQDGAIKKDLEKPDGYSAFLKMHRLLNRTWGECDRVLADHGFICVNIGDAVRTLGGEFRLYPNHSKVIEFFLNSGYAVLPDILWRKPSNAPNKFMGSGMYPAGAYVTYEHEYILIFRKGGRRVFKGKDLLNRRESAYFWEERNVWFSDLWEVKGTPQELDRGLSRSRSASFPFEIPYRLINMYSAKNDTILDPFCGLGTTSLACMSAGRNSVGIEIDREIAELAYERLNVSEDVLNAVTEKRIADHLSFIESLPDDKKKKCYLNIPYQFPVKTRQETRIRFPKVSKIVKQCEKMICY